MARAKKANPKKENDKTVKNTAKQPGTAEQAENTAQQPETTEQAENTAQQPETTEQAENTAQQPEAAEQVQNAAQQTETAEQVRDTTQQPDMFANLPNPCVYCGPSIKGVARQYTTYQGGITDALREFIKECPDALGLIISTGRFQTMRRQLEKPGTPEAELYKAVKARI